MDDKEVHSSDVDSEVEPIQPPEEAKPKNKSSRKKKIITAVVIALLVTGGAAFFFLSKEKEEEPQPSQNEQAAVSEEDIKSKHWLLYLSKTDGGPENTELVYEVSYDGKTVKELKTENGDEIYDSVSPSSKYYVKDDGKSITLYPQSDLENPKVVFTSTANVDEIDYDWYPDESKMIVSTLITRNKPATPGTNYVPDNHQEFFVVDVDTGTKTTLFEHDELYGGAFIEEINPEKGVFYWLTSGEGGLREPLNTSSLETGKVIAKYDQTADKNSTEAKFSNIGGVYEIDGDRVYGKYMDIKSGLASFDTTTFEGGPLIEYTGFTEEPLGEVCSVAELVHSSIFVDDEGGEFILYTLLNNKENTTKLLSYSVDSKEVKEIASRSGLGGEVLLLADKNTVISSTASDGVCGADTVVDQPFTSPQFSLDVTNLSSGEKSKIDLPGIDGLTAEQVYFDKGFHCRRVGSILFEWQSNKLLNI